MALQTVDLPEPDSPTMPKVSPSGTVKETPSHARRRWLPLPKVTVRSSTSIRDHSVATPGRG